jgi:pyruvate/2-oxoglutarate dehydrogenase complex dihydrolipoamide dehydrogenase (E3) component
MQEEKTMKTTFDVIWIGTGQATMSIVPRLLNAGKQVAIIEGGLFGGTCVNNGCTPTKTLVAAARAIYQTTRGDQFGFSVENLQVDFTKVMTPQKNNRQRTAAGIEQTLASYKNSTVFKGYAEFIDTSRVKVNSEVLHAPHIVINTGSHPSLPSVPGIEDIEWLDNQGILDLTELPGHLAIVGGSYIGLEFAQIFRRLGSQVSVFVRGPQLMAREDTDVAEIADTVLDAEGIRIHYNSSLASVSASAENGIRIQYIESDNRRTLEASHILFAIGRRPNTDKLNPQAAGIALDNRGFISVNQYCQTSTPHIYAIGDINGQGAFTHTSVNDGEIFWDHYSRLININTEPAELDRSLKLRNLTYSMFIDPPLARVGLNETEARESSRNILMATMPMREIARAREKQEIYGVVKIFVDAETEEILGATVFGTGGDEVIGAIATFMQTRCSYKLFRRVVFPHPTVGELLPWVLDRLKPLTRQ